MARDVDLVFSLIGKDKTGPAFRAASRNADGTRGAFDKVGLSMSRLAKLAGGLALGAGLVAGTKALAGFAVQATAAASDLSEVKAANEQVFGAKAAGELSAWATSAATALGQTQTQALDAARTFGVFGQAAGLTDTALSGFSMELATLATDLASFSNTTPEEAVEALGAALRGESEPMRRYGVLLDDATLKARAAAMGIYDGSGALTQQQRVLAAHAEILAQTNLQQGDFARTSGGMANQLRVTTAVWGDVKAAAGAALVPLAEAILPAVNEELGNLLAGVQDNMPAIQAAIGEFGADVVERWPEVRAELGGMADAVKDQWPGIVETAGSLASALERVGGMAAAMWSAFQSLPPEVRDILALLAVAKTTGVLDVAFRATDLVKSLFASHVTVVGTTVTAPGAGGKLPGAVGVGTKVAVAGGAAGLVAGAIGASAVVDWSTEGLSGATSAANVYTSALVEAEAAAGDTATATRAIDAAAAGARDRGREFAASLVAGGQAAGAAGGVAGQLAGEVERLAAAGVLSSAEAQGLSAALAGIDPQATIGELTTSMHHVVQTSGVAAGSVHEVAWALLGVDVGPARAAAEGVGLIGPAAGLSADQLAFMSATIAALPATTPVDQLTAAITSAGQSAGLTEDQIAALTGTIWGVPATANLGALQTSITSAGQSAGLTDQQVRVMSSAVWAIPRGATVDQLREALRAAGERAGLTDAQIDGVTSAVHGVPGYKTATIATNAPDETSKVNALQAAINSLEGRTVRVGVSISGSASAGGGPAATSAYNGGAGGVDGWLGGEVDLMVGKLAPSLAGALAGIGWGPWRKPLASYVVSSEWMRGGAGVHYGIDLAAPMGTPIYAASAGQVGQAFYSNVGYGTMATIAHAGGTSTLYAHMSALDVSPGQGVLSGQRIGAVGSTGDSTGPHLHFETKIGGAAVEPRGFMAARGVFLAGGGMVPVNVSAGEYLVPASRARNAYPVLEAINAGVIVGPGGPESDSVAGLAPAGSYVVRAAAVRRNRGVLDRIAHGSQYLAGGGVVGGGNGYGYPGGRVELHISGRVLYGALSDYRRETGRAVLEFDG